MPNGEPVMSGLNAQRIVVPIDFSDLSYAALDRAIEIAGESGEVLAIHALTELSTMEPGNLFGSISDDDRIRSTEAFLQEKLTDVRFARVKAHAVVGDAGREIAAFAEREGADLIVMPSHGYGLIKHLLLGSVAERVVRIAPCPVLVLRSRVPR
jgi:nucleotide-binding universal stress UspA family protein